MKFKIPQHGDERTRTFFAWLPVRDDYEVRWLEKVTVRERYSSIIYACWYVLEFLDGDK